MAAFLAGLLAAILMAGMRTLRPVAVNEEDYRAKLIGVLDLDPAKATDADIDKAIGEVDTAAANAKQAATDLEGRLVTANTKATEAQQRETTANTRVTKLEGTVAAAVKHILDVAVNDARIPAAERASYETKFAADFEGTLAEVIQKQPALNTKEIKIGDRSVVINTAEARSAAMNSLVGEYMTAHPGTEWQAAWSAVANDPKNAALIDAMKTKGGDKK